MTNALKIGRPFGINTYIHWSFWLLPLFVFGSGLLSTGAPTAIIDTAVLLAIFGCVALHELGHALAARQYGIRTRDIVLYPLGGVARLERMPRNPLSEIAVALAGPAVNVAIVIVLLPLLVLNGYHILPTGASVTALEMFWTRLFWGNIILAAFNLLPAFPMDGGRVLRALLATMISRRQATEIAANVGIGFAVLFGIGAVLQWVGPMFLVLAIFLVLVGQAELRSVREEERYRREVPRMAFEDFPRARPVPVLHSDGWEYDPQLRMWTLWRHGVAVKRISALG